ncbi:Ktr system potassium uptake protein B [Alteripontixanthobacter maritimus]|uniref:Ktr system potassium uptake protein B n=1 Tax=Alteripontixanthobacter maritimus TaxID=2161824 RepID=A0A369Q2N2_9SPHN|nr:potassium transporter TrkG [Alteripontixanthobacter maritimus]RDC59024.1 Ktr system potassium uptake protein B [Alteripontixanthobacter maritimus]
MLKTRNPVQLIPVLFLGVILLGTVLLMLPFARAGAGAAPLMTALFTSTSAVAVTGLIVVDTPTYWSQAGQWIIMALFQIGGFGIMTAATFLGLAVGRGVRLSDKMATQVERSRLDLGHGHEVLKLVLIITIAVEALVTLILTCRLRFFYDMEWADAAWHGLFHAISAFNNAGFSSFSDSVMGFQSDWLMLAPIMLAVIVTALGFPVMQELRAAPLQFRKWTLHTKITVTWTAVLLAAGFIAILWAEWANADTLGPMALGDKALNALLHSVMPRTAGFNSLDVSSFRDSTLAVNYVLMFIGGGSAGTAGGIKITTFVVLLAVVWSEIRGHRDASMFGRRFGTGIERQALSVAVLAASLIGAGAMGLLAFTDMDMKDALFEAISAFSTVGLSTGVTGDLPAPAQAIIIALMFIGRVGTITVATALALGAARKPYRFPEENPIVG